MYTEIDLTNFKHVKYRGLCIGAIKGDNHNDFACYVYEDCLCLILCQSMLI